MHTPLSTNRYKNHRFPERAQAAQALKLPFLQDAQELGIWDFLLARSALRRKVALTYGATFHAQQCAEKYLKALLVSRRQVFPRTHDLMALHELCRRHGISVRVEQDKLERLTAYAVQVRYPGADPAPDEAREAVQIAQEVRRWASVMLRPASRRP